MGRGRKEYEIIADILAACKKPAKLIRILQSANINYQTFYKYRKRLLRAGLIEESIIKGVGRTGCNYMYRTTAKGLRTLELLREKTGLSNLRLIRLRRLLSD